MMIRVVVVVGFRQGPKWEWEQEQPPRGWPAVFFPRWAPWPCSGREYARGLLLLWVPSCLCVLGKGWVGKGKGSRP